MIELTNVTKYYHLKGGKTHDVMRDISLCIPEKKSIGILGPNGAGKSTLLRMIGGAEAPNSGTIKSNSSISWPLGVGVGFQGSLTGRQNIEFACRINGLTKAEKEYIIKNVIEFAELGDFFDMPVKSYSSGMRARLGFGLSINFDFDYYLIDELTSVGDAIFRQKAERAFEEIKERASLIFVAHNLTTLKKSCESAIFLRNGNASYYESIDEGIDSYLNFIAEKDPITAKKMARKLAKKATKKKTAKKATRKKNTKNPNGTQ
ncbi:ABC transporter ATP-binding protein [Rubritalea spongiae]|uniref:ABC transporter ATP-binding protein n=1 Tax=Rubritalea spongiae TaxID=430797 RepID=A0ABW5E9Y0_9BACT